MTVSYDDYYAVRNSLMKDGKWNEVHALQIDSSSRRLHEIKEKIWLHGFDSAMTAYEQQHSGGRHPTSLYQLKQMPLCITIVPRPLKSMEVV